MTDTAKKIKAYKELFEIAQEGGFDGYTPGGWSAFCLDPIREIKKDRLCALNETLYNLATREIPNTIRHPYSVNSIEEERHGIQLTLDAGADPNYSHQYSFYSTPDSVFDMFIRNRKYHGALEVAKTEGFFGPQGQKAFNILEEDLRFYRYWGRPYPGETKSESALYALKCKDQKELVYTLFSKGIYPYDLHIRQELQPIFEEEQKKKTQSAHKKTSTQIGKIQQGGRK